MLNRKYNLKLDLQFRCNNSNMKFNQFDKNTSDFFMQINRSGKEIDLSKALVTLMVIKPNGNVDSQFLEVDENGVYANLKPSLKDIPGDYQCKAIVTVKDETVIPEQIFTYTVNEDKFLAAFNSNMVSDEDYSLLTNILGRLSTIETDEEQRQINEATRILNEETRQVEENKRVEAELVREHNDADREKAEAIRETNEYNRKVSENARVEDENLRVEAENNRVDAESSRVEAEKLRTENYDFMTSDEERRRNEENSRIEAEKLRVESEKTRVNEEGKRRTVEQARVSKENERNLKETERQSNENTRKSNENNRVQAEDRRINRYNAFINEAENAANDFKAYASTAKQEEESRKANESARVEAEGRRKDNEVLRVSNENTRKANESKRVEAETARQSKFDAKIVEVNSKVQEVNVAKDAMVSDTKKAIDKMNNDFNSLSASQQQDAEVILARDGEESLNARFERDLYIDGKSLKQEVLDLAGLKESQDMSYETDKGCLVCKQTKNGTVKDLKISGKSLVNLWDINSVYLSPPNINIDKEFIKVVANGTYITPSARTVSMMKPSTEYTIVFEVSKNTCNGSIYLNIDNSNESCFSKGELIERNATGTFIYKMRSKDDLSQCKFLVRTQVQSSCTSGEFVYRCMVLEGDHTQNLPNGHFEGIVSVGTGVDKIEVASVKSDGNLLNVNDFAIDKPSLYGYVQVQRENKDVCLSLIEKDESVDISRISFGFTGNGVDAEEGYDWNIHEGNSKRVLTKSYNYVSFYPKTKDTIEKILKRFDIMVNKGTSPIPYEPYKGDKKPLLFKDTDGTWKPIKELRGLDTACDTVELHSDGKYYYHIRTVKGILNGTQTIKSVEQLSSTNKVQIDATSFKLRTNSGKALNLICDKLPAIQRSNDIPHIRTDGSSPYANLILWLDKSYGDNQESINRNLSSNPITFIGELAEEKVFEVNPLFLEAYEGETMVSVNSGVINTPIEFKIASYISNLVLLNQKRIKELENQMLTMFKSVLNGDMRTLAETIYPEDFTQENIATPIPEL